MTVDLSVLDLIPVRNDQTTADALAASRSLVQLADELGYTRYWVAEHHNMPAVASTNPPVLIAMLAAATSRIRVGSGGVMLPNHAPLVIAEQFALLEAAYPGRIDLGIGRAPGSDPVTNWALRSGAGRSDDDIARFPDYVSDVIALLDGDGVELQLRDRNYTLHATPKTVSAPDVWLLGSSNYSAQLAAANGLPYVFASHFAGTGTTEALALYRSGFVPSATLAAPRTFLTVNVVVAETDAQAQRLALPQLLSMVALRTGGQLSAQRSVEQAELDVANLPPLHAALLADMRESWVIGSPATAGARLQALASAHGVDEIMVNPVAAAVAGTDAAASPAREQTLRLLADELL